MPILPIASQTAARRCGTGPCSHAGPSAGVHVDQTDASLSAEVTSSPTAMASKTSRSVTGAGQRRLQRERDAAAERRLHEEQVGERRPPPVQILLDGEDRLARLLSGHAGPGADGELQALRGVRVVPAAPEGDPLAARVDEA